MGFTDWTGLRERKPESLAKFRESKDVLIRKATTNKSFLRSLDQFQCISDSLSSLSVSYIPASESPTRCLFTNTDQDLYYVNFIRLIEKAPTLIDLHPNLTPTPFYCVSRQFLFYLYGLHFIARSEALFYSVTAEETEQFNAILANFLWCVKFLQSVGKRYEVK